MPVFENLQLWLDPVARPGPEAMAVDEWLLGEVQVPLLRIYRWQGEWGSLGYFGSLSEAQKNFPGLQWVRRWTGGGTVDHREDLTYTLVIPISHPLARTRGAESYRLIHEALAGALEMAGVSARLSNGAEETGAAACFENPVCHDLIGSGRTKLAGAGQRRTKSGLLHQGSVAIKNAHVTFAPLLAAHLSEKWESIDVSLPSECIGDLAKGRYLAPGWLTRR